MREGGGERQRGKEGRKDGKKEERKGKKEKRGYVCPHNNEFVIK